ncbi:hypothetical protein Tco_0928510 [Tanacetum coccineum]
MEQNLTQLCDLDPMKDDTKMLVRCISIWKSHSLGKPNEVWSLDAVLQDEQWMKGRMMYFVGVVGFVVGWVQ